MTKQHPLVVAMKVLKHKVMWLNFADSLVWSGHPVPLNNEQVWHLSVSSVVRRLVKQAPTFSAIVDAEYRMLLCWGTFVGVLYAEYRMV